jgi:hypothetical protein
LCIGHAVFDTISLIEQGKFPRLAQ